MWSMRADLYWSLFMKVYVFYSSSSSQYLHVQLKQLWWQGFLYSCNEFFLYFLFFFLLIFWLLCWLYIFLFFLWFYWTYYLFIYLFFSWLQVFEFIRQNNYLLLMINMMSLTHYQPNFFMGFSTIFRFRFGK